MRVAVIGLGQIGGSICRALAAHPGDRWRVTAWSRSRASLEAAARDGVIDAAEPSLAAAVASTDLIVLAADPAANLILVRDVAPLVAGTAATVTDVSSVQAPMARAAEAVGLRAFVGGHPMAGTERRGYGASDAQLFRGRPWVVLPGPASNESSVARVEALTTRVGARPVRLAAERHDELVAAISHLPLLASLALVEAVTGHASWTDARGLAAGGWAGMTRLAAGDPALGAAILGTNAAHVAGWLRRYREILDAWQERLDGLAADTAAAAHEPIDATDLAALEQKLRALRAQVVEGEGRA